MATANAQDSSETPELSSSSSDKESSCHVDSPSTASKDEEMSIAEIPSSASSKGESACLLESPQGTSKDGDERDIPEMSSLASSKGESSAPVARPRRTSKKDGDEIDIVSSNTESPNLISTVYSSSSRTNSNSLNCCCDPLCSMINKIGCIKNERANRYNISPFFIGLFALLFLCPALIYTEASVFWEFLYGAILLICCSLLTCCVDRGCWSQSACLKKDPSKRGCCSGGGCVEIISPAFRQRKKFSAPVSEEESSKDEVLAVIQEDSPEHEGIAGMDMAEIPRPPSVRVEIAIVD